MDARKQRFEAADLRQLMRGAKSVLVAKGRKSQRFDPAEGGLVCGNCVTDGAATGGRPVSREALALLCDLETTELAGLADGELAPERRREVGALLHRFLGYHLPGYRLPAALDLLRAGRNGTS